MGSRRSIMSLVRCVSRFRQSEGAFWDAVPLELLQQAHIGPRELALAVVGTQEMDVNEWCRQSVDSLDAQTRRYFWELVQEMDDEGRAQLLQCATGSSRPPRGTFAAFSPLFRVVLGDMEKLPSAHMFANLLVLPGPGLSKHELKRRLEHAFSEGHGFGFA